MGSSAEWWAGSRSRRSSSTPDAESLIAEQWRQVIPAAGAALAYGIASALDGSGFIAAFVAGMTFRVALGRDPEQINELSEQVGNVLNGVTFVLFGAILLGPALGELSWELAAYAVLSLTVLRMLPVADRDAGVARQAAHARLPRLVRPPRPGIDRVRGDRRRGVKPSARAPDRARDLPDRRALGLRCTVSAPPRSPAATPAGTSDTPPTRPRRWRASDRRDGPWLRGQPALDGATHTYEGRGVRRWRRTACCRGP